MTSASKAKAKLTPHPTQRYTGIPAACDLCSGPVNGTFVDGKTSHGPWGNMCLPCYSLHGMGLGTGLGTMYEKQPEGHYAKMVPASEASTDRAAIAATKAGKAPKQPSLATLMKWSNDGVAKATDGCRVEPDGRCPHGKPSWLLKMGYL